MAKHPLLRGNWVTPAAALLLSLAFSAGLSPIPASGEEDGGAAVSDSAASADKTKPEEEKTPLEEKTPAEEAAKEKAAEPQNAQPQAAPPETKESKPSASKPAGEKPLRKPVESKEPKGENQKDPAPKSGDAGDLVVRPSIVDAVYRISWLGAHIGDFRIRSSITPRQYSLQANADISVFFGTVSWQGATTSNGTMSANGPVPQNYMFRYATNERRETVELRFQQKMVHDIAINPPPHPGPRNVPITAAHLQNVLDPLSAIVLLSQAHANHGDACNKRLPIFDGKIRYDLVLSPKGTRTVSAGGKLHGTAYVCSVRYVPIAGHKMGKSENDYASGNTGIEVWLVPIPEAGLIVPYYVHVPTPAGTASMVTAKFDVQTPAGRHALAE